MTESRKICERIIGRYFGTDLMIEIIVERHDNFNIAHKEYKIFHFSEAKN